MIDVSFARSATLDFEGPERQCAFCRRRVEVIGFLVAGPGVSICNECNELATSALRRHGVRGFRRWWQFAPRATTQATPHGYREAEARCGFCRQPREGELIRGEHARICAPCVKLVADVLRENARGNRVT